MALESRKANIFKDIQAVFALMQQKHPKQLWLHVNESAEETRLLCEELLEISPSLRLVVFRNNPDVLEGISLLKTGIKGYAHALSNSHILLQIYEAIFQGNVWVYPELMHFMIGAIQTSLEKTHDALSSLSAKEKEIALLVSKGYGNAKIASILNIAEVTVKKHISTLFIKLEVKDRIALALKIKQHA